MKFLALGDSYTIGELVENVDNYPNQIVNLLLQKDIVVKECKIIAKTGWTTNELVARMENEVRHNNYDMVTLLIGVNNQYRNRSTEEFAIHFAYILNRALYYANGNAKNVYVLSIPDWGLTPFNTEKDKQMVSEQIDSFNSICQKISNENGVQYIDITESTRQNANKLDYLADDQLHPSGKEYAIWAKKVLECM